METLDAALHEVENIPAYLPNCLQLMDAVARAKEWLQEADALQVNARTYTRTSQRALIQR